MVLDLNMPDIHGMEVIQFVREHQTDRGTIILALTTRGDESSRSVAMAAAAALCFTKPFLPNPFVTWWLKHLTASNTITPHERVSFPARVNRPNPWFETATKPGTHR